MTPEKISLYYAEGSSDKEYHASLEAKATGFVVNFAYGRRGATLQTGTKTSKPLPYARAKAVYDKLVNDKLAKGYTPGASGTPYQQAQLTDRDQRQTGILPQLLTEIDEAAMLRLLDDAAWWAQQKYDGRRLLIRRDGAGVVGINRSGLTCGLPTPVVEAVTALDTDDIVLDGECVGNQFYSFDILKLDGVALHARPYADRLRALTKVVCVGIADPQRRYGFDALTVAPTAAPAAQKHALYTQLRHNRQEGIVLKRADAPYVAGRHDTQCKFKFVATASCVVHQQNSKRSVALRLFDPASNAWLDVGNVTIPVNHAMPRAGAIVEIRYLYAYRGGSLYQPVYLGPRTDIGLGACLLTQLKYKPDHDDNNEE